MNVVVANPNSLAFNGQLEQVIKLTKVMTKELGYIMPIALRRAAVHGNVLWLMSNQLVLGFCYFHIRRKDKVGVIYDIATHPMIRNQGGGKQMIKAVLERCDKIELKCPVDNKSNGFYSRIAQLVGTEKGKNRMLNLWQITHKTLEGSA